MFPPESRFDRLFVFDHGFGNLPGHWLNYHRAIVDESLHRAIEPHIFGCRELVPELAGDLPATPLFEHGPGAAFGSDIHTNHRLRNQAFLADLGRLDVGDYGPRDLFLFTFVLNYELEAILAFSARFDPDRKPIFLVLLQFDNGLPGLKRSDLPPLVRVDRWLKARFAPKSLAAGSEVAALYRQCLRALPDRRSLKRVVFMAPSAGLDEAFGKILGRTVRGFCMLGPIPDALKPPSADATTREREHPDRLTVGFLGHSCPRKGLQFIPGVVRAIRDVRQDVGFEIHVNYSADQPYARWFDELFNRDVEGAVYRRGHLDAEQYFSLLSRADVVLLPYNHDVYRYMPSGLLREALGAGKVVVIPDETSLARQAASVDAGAVTFAEFTEEAVADALLRAIAGYDALREKAAAAAPRWLREHNPRRFMDQLLEAAALAA